MELIEVEQQLNTTVDEFFLYSHKVIEQAERKADEMKFVAVMSRGKLYTDWMEENQAGKEKCGKFFGISKPMVIKYFDTFSFAKAEWLEGGNQWLPPVELENLGINKLYALAKPKEKTEEKQEDDVIDVEEIEETVKEKIVGLLETLPEHEQTAMLLTLLEERGALPEQKEWKSPEGWTPQEIYESWKYTDAALTYALENKGAVKPLENKTTTVVAGMMGIAPDATLADLGKAAKIAGNYSKLAVKIGVGKTTPSGWKTELTQKKTLTKKASKLILNYLKENS